MLVQTRTLSLRLPPEGFRLVSGACLKAVDVAYEVYGDLNSDKSNAILICSPLTTDAHAAGWHSEADKRPGWWDDLIGPGKAIDTNRYFVIASNMLGGCRGTTGPASLNPDTGKPYGSSFPKITVEDMVNVQRLLVEQLGIDVLEAVIGGSMGGMHALQWSVSFPNQVRKCICIAAAACLSAQALGFEIIGRKVIVNDPDFAGGDYYDAGKPPAHGLAYARMIGHLTYLSAISMHEKFGRNHRDGFDERLFETGFEVENYLQYKGAQFVERFDANSYLHITYAMDRFDLVERYGSLQKAFGSSQSEFLLVALSSDWLFFPEQTRELGKVLLELQKVVSLVELDSPYGHDAFLLEVDHLSQVINGFLEKPAFTEEKPALLQEHLAANAKEKSSGETRLVKSFSSKDDFKHLENLVEPGSYVLDIGCGDGALIDHLYHTRAVTGIGIDIDLEHIVGCLRKNVPVVQSDVDEGLSLFKDKAFDYAILNRTLPVVKKPELVLGEIVRVARKAIVSFPNFACIGNRTGLALKGVMPVTESLPHDWHDTPNIHLFSLRDFEALCDRQGVKIERLITSAHSWPSRLCLALGLPNLGADFVIALLSKR